MVGRARKTKESQTMKSKNTTEFDYDRQAREFLKSTGTKFSIEYVKTDFYFAGDKERRDIYRFTLANKSGRYSSTFGDSYNNTNGTRALPSAYSVLSCLQKSDPGTLDEFEEEYGYRGCKASHTLKTWRACVKAFAGVSRIFTPEQMETLQEIN